MKKSPTYVKKGAESLEIKYKIDYVDCSLSEVGIQQVNFI